MGERSHNKYGWFEGSPRSYDDLVQNYPEVQLFAQSYSNKSRGGYLYALEFFLNINNLSPTEALQLEDDQVRQAIIKASMKKQESGSYGSARRIYYSVKRFYELHDREIIFNRTQRKAMVKWKPKKIAKQHIPSKSEIYRAVDAIPKKDKVQQLRSRAVLLCLYQSGVRGSCLCSWRYGLVKDKLNLDNVPLTIKVVSNRPKGVQGVAVDSKLSGYKLSYYYTFLHKEAVQALRDYIEARKKYEGWEPKESDYLFVTAGTISRGKRLDAKHLNAIVKKAFEQIGIEPESVWTHLLRKSFRKTLYKSGIDGDVCEALMGHKLSQSRTSYFDYSDESFLKEQYDSVNWERLPIKKLETEITKLQENGKSKDERIKELEKQLEYFKSPEFVKDILKNVKAETFKPSKPKKVLTKMIKIGDAEGWKKLSKEGYNLVESNDEYFVMQKEE